MVRRRQLIIRFLLEKVNNPFINTKVSPFPIQHKRGQSKTIVSEGKKVIDVTQKRSEKS